MVKNPPANAGDMHSVLGSGRFPGEGNGNPLPIFLPRRSHRQRSLTGYRPWSHKELDITEQQHTHYIVLIGFIIKDLKIKKPKS